VLWWFLPDHEDEYQDEGKELRYDPTHDPQTHTGICMACYAALTPASPSGLALPHEFDVAAEVLRRRGGLVVAGDSITGDALDTTACGC
jgi:hypothetical protein